MNKKLIEILNGLGSAFRKYPDGNPTIKQLTKEVTQVHDQIIGLWKGCLPKKEAENKKSFWIF